jgi:hypothetical protein
MKNKYSFLQIFSHLAFVQQLQVTCDIHFASVI